MKVQCSACKHGINIPDEKIPEGKTVSITCPKCKTKFPIRRRTAPEAESGESDAQPDSRNSGPLPPGGEPEAATAPMDPFQFLEEGDKTAALCETDPQLMDIIKPVVEASRYHIMTFTNPRETLKQMRFHDFDLVVLNELFGARDPEMNHVLKYVAQLGMASRRKMFVVLLSASLRTYDNMMAFNKSVNLIVNLADMDKFDKLLQRGIHEHRLFYKNFTDILAKVKGV